MATTALGAYSTAYPFITQRIRGAVYLQSDPQALIATQIDNIPGHPARTWMFPGLPYNNYGFLLDIIDANGLPIGNLAKFDVVPGAIDGFLTRKDEQITVGVTPNFVTGNNIAIFDGSNNSPDYRGWTIVPSELTGRGILSKTKDYDWDEVLGKLTLKQAGDVFSEGTDYNIHFDPKTSVSGNSSPTIFDFSVFLITASQVLTVDMFGNKIIAEPIGDYIELTLPPIETVPQGRKLSIEVGGSNCCVRVKQTGSNIINFLRGNIFILSNEKLSIYKFRRSANNYEYRVCDEIGNFHFCGTIVNEDLQIGLTINRHILNGFAESISGVYARLYNELVLNLDNSQVCNFDDWNIGNNKYLYSKANSSNPANINKFHFPDRRRLYAQANDTGKAGDYLPSANKKHTHSIYGILEGNDGSPGQLVIRPNAGDQGNGSGQGGLRLVTDAILEEGEEQGRPESYLINQYVLL